MITDTGECNKYFIKYVGNIDEQNYVVAYSDGSRNVSLITKSIFLHNTKLAGSKHNEDKAKDKKRESSHATGHEISLPEMIHCILRYSEVATDMYFIDISTTSLETRISYKVERKKCFIK